MCISATPSRALEEIRAQNAHAQGEYKTNMIVHTRSQSINTNEKNHTN